MVANFMILLDAEMWESEAHGDGLFGPRLGQMTCARSSESSLSANLVDVTSLYHSLSLFRE
jgi:hypothetical protein